MAGGTGTSKGPRAYEEVLTRRCHFNSRIEAIN
jgi:hypothetical protein